MPSTISLPATSLFQTFLAPSNHLFFHVFDPVQKTFGICGEGAQIDVFRKNLVQGLRTVNSEGLAVLSAGLGDFADGI